MNVLQMHSYYKVKKDFVVPQFINKGSQKYKTSQIGLP